MQLDCVTPQTTLEQLLAHRNQDVIDAFRAGVDVSTKEANEIFGEFLKFIWICETSSEKYMKVIDSPILIIDEMWHAYILFTKEYQAFCTKFFGHFIHHAPTTEREKKRGPLLNPDEMRARATESKRARYDAIYEILGRNTFIKWYFVFPNKYSTTRILELRRK